MEFLLWTKGPMFDWALAIFAIGIAARLVEIFMLGRKPNYAEPRGGEWGPGFKTMIRRTVADPGTFARAPFDVVLGIALARRLPDRPAAVHSPHRADQQRARPHLAGTAQPGGGRRLRRDHRGPGRRPGAPPHSPGEEAHQHGRGLPDLGRDLPASDHRLPGLSSADQPLSRWRSVCTSSPWRSS